MNSRKDIEEREMRGEKSSINFKQQTDIRLN